MRFDKGFIAVDWGTTNRRAFRIDGDGNCTGEMEDGMGALAVPPGQFARQARILREKFGDLPLLLAGMAGSNRGWVDAGYVDCPAGADELVEKLVRLDQAGAVIVPGLAFRGDTRCDVMRGEEVQIFGAAAAGLLPDTSLVCHPGTHSKWALVEKGRVEAFTTVMTGEMFALLKAGSIISDLLQDTVDPGSSAFCEGVKAGLQSAVLTADLFTLRARFLLGRLDRSAGASWCSGLLIGADIRAGMSQSEGALVVMGSRKLTALYAKALELAGRTVQQVDGKQAFVAGAQQIARGIR